MNLMLSAHGFSSRALSSKKPHCFLFPGMCQEHAPSMQVVLITRAIFQIPRSFFFVENHLVTALLVAIVQMCSKHNL